jgi:hypothetical protein
VSEPKKIKNLKDTTIYLTKSFFEKQYQEFMQHFLPIFLDLPLYSHSCPAPRTTHLLSDKDPTSVPVRTSGQSFYCLQL